MNFNYYKPFFSSKLEKWSPGIVAQVLTPEQWERLKDDATVARVVDEIASSTSKEEISELKKNLPAVTWMGSSKNGRRSAESMRPTGLIMLDIDKMEESPFSAMLKIGDNLSGVRLIHVTPSGKGLRIVFENDERFDNVEDNVNKFYESHNLQVLGGTLDKAVKDLSRLSFVVPRKYVLYENNLFGDCIVYIKESSTAAVPSGETAPSFSDDETKAFEESTYRGTPLKEIIERYVKEFGEPGEGERHNYYNNMVKNFRCIMDNNKRKLLYLLPRFGHTADECWSQIVSICRVNTLSRLPRDFYFFLKDNGYYQHRATLKELEEDGVEEIEETADLDLPKLPPVFREILKTCPKDFIVPCVDALLPIMGTLTSYLRAVYPYDNRVHSTSFFSVIYAPPGTGKGFVERFLDLLFEDLRLRDLVSSCRENIYLSTIRKKSANDKSPEEPHTSTRIIPAKNSEAEFLMKQSYNKGYHMFTYAAEMDSWAKGAKAAGGNKDDMIRIAWDNGEYGQQFRSANTFKGIVNLYWNVLITGTLNQVEKYFNNVENGLVTRCSFSSIDNQEFAEAPKWKTLSKRDLDVIRKFRKRCDERSYQEPCTVDPALLSTVSDDDFDKEIPWRFNFRPFMKVDMEWIMPVISGWLKEQLNQAVLDADKARDVFRRRCAVRGFRLALLCYGLWDKPSKSNLDIVKDFVRWYMNEDMKGIMKLFGQKYNEVVESEIDNYPQRKIFSLLNNEFTRADVYVVCKKQNVLSKVSHIIYQWKKLGLIEKTSSKTYKKVNNEKSSKN